ARDEAGVGVVSSRGDLVSGGAEGHADDSIGMAAERRELAAGVRVPEPDGLVIAPRDDPPAVAVEREAVDRPPMTAEDPRLSPGGGAPEADRAVGRGHGDAPAVGAIGGVERPVVEGVLRGRGVVGEATEIERLQVAPGPAVVPLPAAPRRVARVEE